MINSNGIDSVVVRDAYEWLITWLVVEMQRKFDEGIAQGLDNFTARSRSQVYRAANLSKAYGEVRSYYKYNFIKFTEFSTKNNTFAKGIINSGATFNTVQQYY